VRKTLPKIFGCPRCGSISVKITTMKDSTKGNYYHIICGNEKCQLADDITTSQAPDTIDAYNRFVDDFNKKVIG
jgi:transcription elongation factor Elf1